MGVSSAVSGNLRLSKRLRLPEGQYVHQRHKKSLIVLHHTAGADAESTFRWWLTDPKRIGTAYIVARDGRIFEVFPPEYWAFHLGVKGQRQLDRRSIGIELANAGW